VKYFTSYIVVCTVCFVFTEAKVRQIYNLKLNKKNLHFSKLKDHIVIIQ